IGDTANERLRLAGPTGHRTAASICCPSDIQLPLTVVIRPQYNYVLAISPTRWQGRSGLGLRTGPQTGPQARPQDRIGPRPDPGTPRTPGPTPGTLGTPGTSGTPAGVMPSGRAACSGLATPSGAFHIDRDRPSISVDSDASRRCAHPASA